MICGCGSVGRAVELPTPEVRGLNPFIGQLYFVHLFAVNCIEKTKIKIKEAVNSHPEHTI